MTTTAPLTMPYFLLLAKAEGQFKHSGKYYLHNGRWHKIQKDKPAPKKAPTAAHLSGVGKYPPAKHFSDDEWQQLKLPDDNVNAGSHNKKLDELKALSESGNVAGILAHGYGTNTYGKQAAKVANKLLSMHGVAHKVEPGQKPGEHPALHQQGPRDGTLAGPAAGPIAKHESGGSLTAKQKEIVSGIEKYLGLSLMADAFYVKNGVLSIHTDSLQQHQIHAIENYGTQFGKFTVTPGGHKKISLVLPKKSAGQTPGEPPAQANQAPRGDTGAPAAPVEAPAQGKPKIGPVGQALKDALEPKPAEPATPAAPGQVPPAVKSKLDQIPWDSLILPDSNKNAKSHNGKINQIKEAAYAGDTSWLAAFKAGVNTYGKKQNLTAQAALAAFDGAQSAPTAVAADDGPKDGDMKQGAEGMLVFKNGRWHKMDKPEVAKPAAAAEEPTGLDALAVPDFSGKGLTSKEQAAFEKITAELLAAAKADGAAGLKGKIVQHKAGKKAGYFSLNAGGFKVKNVSGKSPKEGWNDLHTFISGLLVATGKAKKTAKPKVQPAASAMAADSIEAMDSWEKTGGQLGSNDGGRFKDPNGVEWYCKFPADEDMAKAEILSAKLYGLAGLSAQDAKLITRNGKVGIASRWVDISKGSPEQLAALEDAQSGFAVDAWLANWDVVGQGYDNLQIGPDGKAHRVDAGGSLMYRAQGEKKAFGPLVGEIDSMRDKKINSQAAAVFGSMTEADITASVAKVLAISDVAIRQLVEGHGPGDADARKALADTLIARKKDLASKYPAAAKAKKPKAAFNISNLTTPPDFTNWNGSGKGLSSLEFINNSNNAAVAAVYEAAKLGDLKAIERVKAPIFDKKTGEIIDHVPLKDHPSQHVRAYWSNLVYEVDLQLNPPRMPDLGLISDSQDLAEISALFKPVASGKAVGLVDKHQKAGDYIVLGQAANIAALMPTADDSVIASPSWIQKAKSLYHAASAAAKSTFGTYLSTSGAKAINTALRNGNISATAHGKTVKQHVEDFKGLLVDIPPGSTFVRNMGEKGFGAAPSPKKIKDLQQFLMTAKPGTIVQEPGFTSSSWTGGNSVLGNNDIQWEFVAGPGVKMYPAWLTENAGEGEGLMPPNQRYAIVSSKKVGKTVQVKAILLPTIE